jgi:hypothetical protein
VQHVFQRQPDLARFSFDKLCSTGRGNISQLNLRDQNWLNAGPYLGRRFCNIDIAGVIQTKIVPSRIFSTSPCSDGMRLITARGDSSIRFRI